MRNENTGVPEREGPQRGRPKRWSDARARLQHHRAQAAEQRRLTRELIEAARAARWSDALHERIQFGADPEVLQALIDHYRSRHWGAHRTPGPEEGGPSETE